MFTLLVYVYLYAYLHILCEFIFPEHSQAADCSITRKCRFAKCGDEIERTGGI